MWARFTVLSEPPRAVAIAGCAIRLSRRTTIWMRWRCAAGIFHRSAVLSPQRGGPGGTDAQKRWWAQEEGNTGSPLVADLKSLVEAVTRGDPMRPLLWTTRTPREVELTES